MEIITDNATWNRRILDEFSDQQDIYFLYEYFDLYRDNYACSPEAIYWEDSNIKVFWTHLIRKIQSLSFLPDTENLDLTTPYGYGGPIIQFKTKNQMDIANSTTKFCNEYQAYCNDQNYLSEFIRYQPILGNHHFFEKSVDNIYTNDVVAIDLTDNLEVIHGNFDKDIKRLIKKTLNANAVFHFTTNPSNENIDDFMRLYQLVLNRNNSPKKYRFSRKFISDHFKLLAGKCAMGFVEYESEIIGSGLFLFHGSFCHYHLSGTQHIKGINSNDLMLWEITKIAKERNLKYLHLGGGRGSNDSLYKFKKGFSKQTFPFHFGKAIYNNSLYSELSKLNQNYEPGINYFPLYRYGQKDSII